jgi:DNA-binding XRE family transcriptional regulator
VARKHRFESSALQYLYNRYVGSDSKRQAHYEESVSNARVAMQIYALRTEARLSQAELARKVGTSRSVISRLEDADYRGHSLSLLRRIARALDRVVEVRFMPARRAVGISSAIRHKRIPKAARRMAGDAGT